MEFQKTEIERAFELAHSGRYFTPIEIAKRLRQEGFSAEHLTSRSLRMQLSQMIETAKSSNRYAARNNKIMG
jgi:hypothetical protein